MFSRIGKGGPVQENNVRQVEVIWKQHLYRKKNSEISWFIRSYIFSVYVIINI